MMIWCWYCFFWGFGVDFCSICSGVRSVSQAEEFPSLSGSNLSFEQSTGIGGLADGSVNFDGDGNRTKVYSFHPKDFWKFDLDISSYTTIQLAILNDGSSQEWSSLVENILFFTGWLLMIWSTCFPSNVSRHCFDPNGGVIQKKTGKLFTLGNCHSYDKFRDIAIFMLQVLQSHVFLFAIVCL